LKKLQSQVAQYDTPRPWYSFSPSTFSFLREMPGASTTALAVISLSDSVFSLKASPSISMFRRSSSMSTAPKPAAALAVISSISLPLFGSVPK